MVMCPKCGKMLEDGMRFCDNCGAQMPETVVCPNCGERAIAGFAFCQKCGTPISQTPDPSAGYAPGPSAGYAPDPSAGYAPGPSAGYVPGPSAGYASGPSAGYAPGPSAGYAPDPSAGYAPDPSAGYAPDPSAGYTPDPSAGYASGPSVGYAPDPSTGYNAGYTPNPDPSTGFIPNTDFGAGSGYAPNPNPAPAKPQQKKKGIPKQVFIFGGIGVAAVAVIVALVMFIPKLFGGGTSDKTYMFYLKDREIVYLDLKSENKLEVTSRLLNGGLSDYNLANSAYALGSFIAFNEDSSRIFYPDRTDFSNAEGITLYYRNMKKTDEEPVKIDSDITAYAINKAGTVVIYSKGSDGNLYRHDLTNKEKIASAVEGFDVADDCNKVLYLTEDESIYLWTAGGDKTKLASDIYDVKYVSDDLSVIYYTKKDSDETSTYSLYKQVEGADERVKIASEISRIVNIYDSGEVYYIKSESVELNLIDYVNDDMAASDAAMTEPVWPTYPTAPANRSWYTNYNNDEYPWYYYDYTNSYWGERVNVTQEEYDAWQAQYAIDYAAYQEAYDAVPALREEYNNVLLPAYWAKQNRDYLRESLKEAKMEQTEYTLYYYNGTEETIVTDALASPWDVSYAADTATLLLSVYNQAEVTKAKISEVEYIYEIREMIDAALYSSSERYVAVQATLTVVDRPDASYFRLSSDGSTIFFLDDMNEDNDEGDLYKITIENGQVGRPEMYDSDVSTSYMYFSANNQFVYYKDVDESNEKGDLYVDKTQIDYDVRLTYITYLGDAVLYYTDWNDSKNYGTLKMYNNGEKTKVADDVHSFVIMDNDILYLYDYSSSSYKGTLYRYNQGNPVKIDDDVMALIPVSGSKLKGINYYGW